MTGFSFPEHLALAKQRPDYWSYLASLEFIDRLVEEMDRQDVRSAELARRIGASRAYVSKVLAGEGNLTIATMGKLAFALGMKVTTALEPIAVDDLKTGAGNDETPRQIRRTA